MTNYKAQMPNKAQITKLKVQIRHLDFGIWNLDIRDD
jgi:hypothetical protein